MKKTLALFLSLILVLLPMTAMAEADAGYVALKLIDPVLSYAGMEIDLTGLEVDLSMAVDGSDVDDMAMTVTGAALVNGTEAISGAAAMNMTEVAFRINGMQNAYKMAMEALLEDSGMTVDMLKESMAGAAASAQPSTEVDFEKIAEEWMEMFGPLNEEEAEIEYEGQTVTAKSMTITMGKPELIGLYEKLFAEMNMGDQGAELIAMIDESIQDMNVVITAYEIDENTVVEDIDMRITADDETVVGNGRFTVKEIEGDDGMDMSGTMTIGPEDGVEDEVITMDLSMQVAETEDFEDATMISFNMVITPPTDVDEPVTMSMDLIPKAVADGFHYDYSFNMVAEDVKFDLGGSTEKAGGKLSSDLAITFSDGVDGGSFDFSITGDITEGDDYTFAGNLHIGGTIEEQEMKFDTKIEATYSENLEGRMLDIASLNALDLMDQSAEDMEAFQEELTALTSTVTVAMMQLPGVQALMGAMAGAAE